MSEDAGRFPAYLKQGIQAIVFWVLMAVGMLTVVSLVLWKLELSSRSLAYGSALISFISAAAVAWKMTVPHRQRLLSAIALAGILLIFLLGIGFLLSEGELSRDAVLSAASFTVAGCMVGDILAPQQKSRIKHPNVHKRNPRQRKLT